MRQTSRVDRALGIVPWIPAILGIGALVTLLAIAIRLTPWATESSPLPPPQPPLTLPEAGPTLPPPSATPTSAAPPTSATPPTSRTTPPTSRPVPVGRTSTVPPPLVTGRYQVVDSFPDSFIGQVLITNTLGADRNWTVRLTFPSDVGDLRTSWLEGLPQPTLAQNGRTFTWRSTTPLPAGATGMLRFHFERPGTAETPSHCLTNGRTCR